MTHLSDFATMTPAQRQRAIGALLATAYRRLLLSRQKELESSPHPEPSCEPAVHESEDQARNPSSPPSIRDSGKEVA